jgi:D-alanyl-D-alanine carboxypeptidase
MSKKNPDKNLEDFRYDAELFKQAYKAGLKAREVEEESKRKRLFKIFVSIPVLFIMILLAIWIIKNPLFMKENYLRMDLPYESFSNVETSFKPSEVSEIKFDKDFINAKAALYADLNTGQILYSKNPTEKLYIASVSKLMSALVVVSKFDLDKEIEVQKDWYNEDISWSLGFDKGDKVLVETLLQAMLISSYNDASYILANNYKNGVDDFVKEMNNYAKKFGLNDTEFNNPSGLDTYGGNISTVNDLYKLASIIYKNEVITDILSKNYADLSWDIGGERIYTTDVLKGQYGYLGGKTGYTELAGGCFLGITKEGRVTIVLGSESKFEDSKKLLLNL